MSGGTITEQHFWKKILKTPGLSDTFRSFRDNGGKKFGGKKRNRYPREQFMEKFFSKEKISLLFLILSGFFTSSENFRQICKTRNLRVRGSFWGINFLRYIYIYKLLHFSGFWSKESLDRKFFFRVVTTAIRASRGFFLRKSKIFLRKVTFVHLFWSLSTFFVFWQKKVRMSKEQPANTEKKLEERICRKIVY